MAQQLGEFKTQLGGCALLEEWLFRARRAQLGHYDSANHFDRLHLWIGLPTVVLTTFVGTSVFASMQKDASFAVKMIVATASVIAAVMASIQTFLRFGERGQKHRTAGIQYAALRRDLEEKIAFCPTDPQELQTYVGAVRERMNKLNDDCPTCPDKIWQAADRKIVDRMQIVERGYVPPADQQGKSKRS